MIALRVLALVAALCLSACGTTIGLTFSGKDGSTIGATFKLPPTKGLSK